MAISGIDMARRDAETERKVEEAFDTLISAINGGLGKSSLANLVARQHPTLSGQLAKFVALGIMRRSTRNENFRAFDSWEMDCRVKPFTADNPPHPDHDGRHDCQTVIGAMLMAGQSYI